MGRGSRSGLHILSPDPQTAVRACRQLLSRSGQTAAQAQALRAMFPPMASPGETLPPIHDLFAKILTPDD